MGDYSEYDSIKLKMRLPDDTLKEEIVLYIQEVDDLINNRIRNKLGTVDFNKTDIVLPLDTETEPEIDEEIKAIAADMVEGKFRLKTSEKPLLWDTGVKNLDNYLDRRFGWTRDIQFRQLPQVLIVPLQGPVGTLVTLDGVQWRPNSDITIQFQGQVVVTVPSLIVTDAVGEFAGVTFNVPQIEEGGKIINIFTKPVGSIFQREAGLGKEQSKQLRFQVTP